MSHTNRNSILGMIPGQLEALAGLLDAKNRGIELFFVENWNPKMETNINARFRFQWPKTLDKNPLLGKEINLSDFPIWKNISIVKSIRQLELYSANPRLPIKEDKSAIISSVDHEDYRFGLLICMGPENSIWENRDIELINTFRKLMGSEVVKNKVFVREIFDLEVQLIRKDQLKKDELSNKNKFKNTLSDFAKEAESEQCEGGTINWNDEGHEIEEVVISIQAYTKNSIDPVKSAWYKLRDTSIIRDLNKSDREEPSFLKVFA